MTFQAIATLIYGLVIFGGGIMGYIAAKSVPSLIAGGLLGLAAVIGAIFLFMGRPVGKQVALVATILVGAFFGFQLIKGITAGGGVSGRAGGILALSITEILILLFAKDSAA
jgi:uncharacterized membrane protein (UPF0136 family)